MPTFEIEWTAKGTTTLEADDEDEARILLCDGVENFEHTMFDTIEIEYVTIDSATEL